MSRENIKKFYQQYRVIIFPVITAGAALMLIGIIIIPQLLKLISNNESYHALQQRNGLLEVKASELNNINVADLKQQVDLSLVALPENRDLTESMSLLQSVVSQFGFTLASLNFGSGITDHSTSGYSVRLDVTGPRANLVDLLTGLETTYRSMKVSNVDLFLSKTGDEIDGTINVNVFYAPIPKAVGSIDAPIPKLSSAEQELIAKLGQSISLTLAGETDMPNDQSVAGKSDPFE